MGDSLSLPQHACKEGTESESFTLQKVALTEELPKGSVTG